MNNVRSMCFIIFVFLYCFCIALWYFANIFRTFEPISIVCDGHVCFTHLCALRKRYTNSVGVYVNLQSVLSLLKMSTAVTAMFSFLSNLFANISQKQMVQKSLHARLTLFFL